MFVFRALQGAIGSFQPPVDTAAPLVMVLNQELADKDAVLYNIYEEAFGALQLIGDAFSPADLGNRYADALKYIVEQLQSLPDFDPRYSVGSESNQAT